MAALLTATPGGGKPRTVTLVGAGDIAGCDFKADRKTARLVGRIGGTVFTLGDNAYQNGTRKQFRNCYRSHLGHLQQAHQALPRRPRPHKPQGRSPTSITSDGVRASPAEATTLTIGDPGTSWP
jgi:hypothetical protein